MIQFLARFSPAQVIVALFVTCLLLTDQGCSGLQHNVVGMGTSRSTARSRGNNDSGYRQSMMTTSVRPRSGTSQVVITQLNMAAGDDDFWKQQQALVQEMSGRAEKSLKQEQMEKFAKRRAALVGDTAFFTALICSFLWAAFDNPFLATSYLFGATFGLAYAYGLGKYVETIGGSVDDTEATAGAGLGQARFAFLILLFVLVGKFRTVGLLELPSIAGFFTYQLASLSQGLRDIND